MDCVIHDKRYQLSLGRRVSRTAALLLQAGTVSEVEEYCRSLINICGKDGGFIMTTTALDEASPENVKAMIDVTKTTGGTLRILYRGRR